jgi:hypothetical protein
MLYKRPQRPSEAERKARKAECARRYDHDDDSHGTEPSKLGS